MNLKIVTTAKAVEATNCILGQAIDQIINNGNIAKSLGLSALDVVLAEQFRQRILKAYLKQ
jgi:hypothetical protein